MSLKSLNERKDDLVKQVKKKKSEKKEAFEDGLKEGIDESFHSFSDLIEQYLTYKDNVKKLMTDEKSVWKKWVKYYENQSDISKSDYIDIYNTWLFDYLFCNELINGDMFTSLY